MIVRMTRSPLDICPVCSLDDEQRCPAATAKCYVDCTKPGSHKAGSLTGAWWNVTNDPRGEGESPLWAFSKYRALNRLALRTKLTVVASPASPALEAAGFTVYKGENSWNGHGGVPVK